LFENNKQYTVLIDYFGISLFCQSLLQKSSTMWWMYALLSAFFAALTAIFAKMGIKNMDTDLATAIRTVIILILAWGFVLYKGTAGTMGSLSKQNWIFLILSGCATGLSWIFYFKALQLGEVSQVAPVDKLSVAIAIILAIVFLGEPITWKSAVGALMIMGGTFVLILK
jgi:transporter family protein